MKGIVMTNSSVVHSMANVTLLVEGQRSIFTTYQRKVKSVPVVIDLQGRSGEDRCLSTDKSSRIHGPTKTGFQHLA